LWLPPMIFRGFSRLLPPDTVSVVPFFPHLFVVFFESSGPPPFFGFMGRRYSLFFSRFEAPRTFALFSPANTSNHPAPWLRAADFAAGHARPSFSPHDLTIRACFQSFLFFLVPPAESFPRSDVHDLWGRNHVPRFD